MTVDVQLGCSASAPEATLLRHWTESALNGEESDVCVRIVDRGEGADLNHRFRGRAGATNVLAFPANETGMLGDIAICAPVVAEEALAQGKPLAHHYAHLVVHGVLHLLGMDHATLGEARTMEEQEVKLLARLGIANPYGPDQ